MKFEEFENEEDKLKKKLAQKKEKKKYYIQVKNLLQNQNYF